MRSIGLGWTFWRVSASAAFLACGLATLLFTTGLVIAWHVPLMAWDEWYLLSELQSYASGDHNPSFLIQQHNEHRILLSKISYLIDYLFFDLQEFFTTYVILVLQFLNGFILISMMLKLVRPWSDRILLGGFTLLMMFTLRQEQNFTNAFQICFTGVVLATTLAIVTYVDGLERLKVVGGRPWPQFAWATLLCGLSTFSMANGVLAGFVLAVVAILWRAPWWIAAGTLALSVALAWLFFLNYTPGAGPPLSQAIHDPLPYLSYTAAYLGNFIDTGPVTTQVLGALGLLATAAGAFRIATGRERRPASLVLLAIAGFMVATAIATAYGRISLGIEQASESRYATFTEIFWTALVLFWFPVAVQSRASWLGIACLTTAIAFLTGTAIYSEVTVWPELAVRATAMRHVADSILSGVYDTEAASYEYMTKDEISHYLPFLRDHHLSIFADPVAAAYGRNVATPGSVAPPGTCRGRLEAEADPTLGDAGVRLSGDVFKARSTKVPRRIVVARSGTVVGFGSASLPGEAPHDWSGYAKSAVGDTLVAYARLQDGSLCDLGRTDVKSSSIK